MSTSSQSTTREGRLSQPQRSTQRPVMRRAMRSMRNALSTVTTQFNLGRIFRGSRNSPAPGDEAIPLMTLTESGTEEQEQEQNTTSSQEEPRRAPSFDEGLDVEVKAKERTDRFRRVLGKKDLELLIWHIETSIRHLYTTPVFSFNVIPDLTGDRTPERVEMVMGSSKKKCVSDRKGCPHEETNAQLIASGCTFEEVLLNFRLKQLELSIADWTEPHKSDAIHSQRVYQNRLKGYKSGTRETPSNRVVEEEQSLAVHYGMKRHMAEAHIARMGNNLRVWTKLRDGAIFNDPKYGTKRLPSTEEVKDHLKLCFESFSSRKKHSVQASSSPDKKGKGKEVADPRKSQGVSLSLPGRAYRSIGRQKVANVPDVNALFVVGEGSESDADSEHEGAGGPSRA